MHSMQPPTRKRAVFAAIVWIATMVCLLAWMSYLGLGHLMAGAG